ncbi:MAG: MEMO1 family protein, partial [Acidobacteriota bacterium]
MPRLRFSATPAELALVRAVVEEIHGAASEAPTPRALVAPHLDLALARPSYRAAFAALGPRPPGRVILLATGHALADRPIALTESELETRFGCWPTDREAVRALRAAGGDAVAAG